MRITIPRTLLTAKACALLLLIAALSLPVAVAGFQNKVAAGVKMKLKGRITQREAETFSLQDKGGATTIVVLTDTTDVKSAKKGLGVFRRGEEYAVTSLIRGLIVEVEGSGNDRGQLVAEKIRFSESDLKTALTVESRVAPVEEANKKLAGQVEESTAIAKDAKSSADSAHARISGLDNFDEKSKVTVYFDVNSYVITPAHKAELDTLAKDALASTGYILEVTGFADPTGNASKNLELSQQRADTVVKYLAITGNVPMRRIVTPIGYGATRSGAADTAEAKRQERRVEAKLLISRGMTQ
jgi:Outer membrane protein and related peptidoglycan-associated (lipo)proteins